MTALTREQQQLVESVFEEVIGYATAMEKRLGFPEGDLTGEVHLELVTAVLRADSTRETRFIAYAFPGVKGAVIDAASKERGVQAWAFAARVVRQQHGFIEGEEDEDAMEVSLEPIAPRASAVDRMRERIAAIAGAVAIESARPHGDSEMVDALFQRRQEAELRRCIAELPSFEQQVVQCRVCENKTLNETAAQLGVSSKTVQRAEAKVGQKLGRRLRVAGFGVP